MRFVLSLPGRFRVAIMPPSRSRFSLMLVFLALAIAVAFLAAWPAYQGLRRTQRELILVQARLEREREVVAAYDALEISVSEHANEVVRAERALPTSAAGESDVPTLLTTLEGLAEREAGGIFLQAVRVSEVAGSGRTTPGAEPEPHGLYSRSISLDGLGTYEGVLRFLDAMEASLRILEPETVSFTTTTNQDVVPFSMTLRTFVQVP